MNKLIVSVLAASLAACASQSSTRRPAATAQTEPAPDARRTRAELDTERDTKQESVRPVAVAPVDRAAIDADARDRDVRDNRDNRDVRDVRDNRDARDTRDVRDTRKDNALDQGNSDSDLENARKVRAAVTDDASLSFAAKNVQIVSNQGEIKLRGTVKNEKEKRAIEKYAREVVGTAHVHSDLTTEQ